MLVKRETLLVAEGSVLARMFAVDSPFTFDTDGRGALLRDRDPEAFQWVLGVLRRGGTVACAPPALLADRVRNEADYFGLDDIVRAIDVGQTVEQKHVTTKLAVTSEGTTVVEDGWVVKSITCASASQKNESYVWRTVLLERPAQQARPLQVAAVAPPLILRKDRNAFEFFAADFGGMHSVSANTADVFPWNMSGNSPGPGLPAAFARNAGSLAGRVAVAGGGGASFVDKARLAMNSGAVALIICSESNTLGPLMAGDEDASDINIPVVMVGKRFSFGLTSPSVVVDLQQGGARR